MKPIVRHTEYRATGLPAALIILLVVALPIAPIMVGADVSGSALVEWSGGTVGAANAILVPSSFASGSGSQGSFYDSEYLRGSEGHSVYGGVLTYFEYTGVITEHHNYFRGYNCGYGLYLYAANPVLNSDVGQWLIVNLYVNAPTFSGWQVTMTEPNNRTETFYSPYYCPIFPATIGTGEQSNTINPTYSYSSSNFEANQWYSSDYVPHMQSNDGYGVNGGSSYPEFGYWYPPPSRVNGGDWVAYMYR